MKSTARSVKKLYSFSAKYWKVLLLLAGGFAAAGLEVRLRAMDSAWVLPPESLEQSLHPKAAEILSFGHLPALVDGLVIRGIADPAIDPVAPGTHPPLYYLMDLATQLDPFQFELYWISATLISIVRWDGTGAGEILDRSHRLIVEDRYPEPGFRERYWKSAWQLEMMRGYNALFELHDLEKARESFGLSGKLPGGLPFLERLAQLLGTREGRIQVAARTLDSLLKRANDPVTEQRLKESAGDLKFATFLLSLEKEFLASKMKSFDRFLESRAIASDPRGGRLRWNSTTGRIETTSDLGRVGRLYF